MLLSLELRVRKRIEYKVNFVDKNVGSIVNVIEKLIYFKEIVVFDVDKI